LFGIAEGKSSARQLGLPNGCFTLLELMTVVGVIVMLAALLLPALAGARMAAYRIQCASNLKQIGTALTLYVDDFSGYPAFGYYRWEPLAVDPRSIFWDAKLLRYAGENQGIFLCPGMRDGTNWWLVDAFGVLWPNKSYGYNGPGVGRCEAEIMKPRLFGLGLDPMGERVGGLPQLFFRLESKVAVPSDMIALIDYDPLVDDDGDGDLHPDAIYSLTLTGTRHKGCANVAFCDTHIEHTPTCKLTAPGARQRWNFDHLPHPDVYPYFPANGYH
jgi:prepilin-type processing-associated H-X9-DG protein